MLLDGKVFLIKEQVSFLKLAGKYDIFDPNTGQQLGVVKEEPSGIIKLLRLFINKLLLPNKINVYDSQGQAVVFPIHKPLSFFRAKVSVLNKTGESLGYFQSKLLIIGGGFWVFDPANTKVAEIKGDWKGWNFQFINADGRTIGTITKKWAGVAKELFTADNYVISMNEAEKLDPDRVALLLATGLAIDLIFKEKK